MTAEQTAAQEHNRRAIALCAAGEWGQALTALHAALTLDPGNALYYHNLGIALRKLGHGEDAEQLFAVAVQLAPAYAEAWGQLARARMELGRLAEAAEAALRAVDLEPGRPFHYRTLAGVHAFTAGDPYFRAMRDLAAREDGLPPQERLELHFALAKAWEDAGDPRAAFDHLLRGNRLKRQSVAYDEAAEMERFARIERTFTPDLFRRLAGRGDERAAPIFILGMPRSGSTLVEQILGAHPQVAAAGELDSFAHATRTALEGGYPEAVANLGAEGLGAVGEAYLTRAPSESRLGERFFTSRPTDKMPNNFLYAGLIALALPRARIVHTRRDPLDTCLSCFSKLFTEGNEFSWDLGELGRYYQAYARLMEHWRRVLPEGLLLDVTYRDVVDDLEGQARRLLDHCGLDWTPACLEFHRATNPVRTASWGQVRQPITRSRLDRWQAYGDRLDPLRAALGQDSRAI